MPVIDEIRKRSREEPPAEDVLGILPHDGSGKRRVHDPVSHDGETVHVYIWYAYDEAEADGAVTLLAFFRDRQRERVPRI